MKTRPQILLALSVLMVFPLALPAAEEVGITDEWHLVYLGEKPAGYLRITSRPRTDGGRSTTMAQKLTLRRGSTTVETEMSVTTEEDADGKFLAYRSRQKLSRMEMESIGTVEDGVLIMKDTTGGGKPTESRIPADPSAIGPHFAEAKMKREMQKTGDSVEVVLFLPEVRRFVKQKAVMEREEAVELQGSRQTLRRLSITQDALPGVTIREWIDEEFRLQKSSMVVFGMDLVTYRSNPEAVLAQDFSSPPEIFLSCSVPVKGSIPRGARKATYRLVTQAGEFPVASDSHLFRSPGQSLFSEEGSRSRVLRIVRALPTKSVQRPVSPTPALSDFLRSNAYVQSDDDAIVKIARDAVGKEDDAWKAARSLERWVHRNIRQKNLNTAFASAREVARTREGDCTEHSVLLAALLRSVGVPSRVVAGLLYHKGAFVGHMWNEIHVGEWTPLDATLGEGLVGASHIALSASSLDSASASSFFLELIPIFGNLKIEVLEVSE